MKCLHVTALALGLVTAGCCDKAAVQACEAKKAEQTERALANAVVVNGPGEAMALRVARLEDVELNASVVQSTCSEGRATAASVQVTWHVKTPGVGAVRILVGSGEEASKTWVEAGASGSQTTGPWIGDGALLRMESLATRETLGLIRVSARACQ